MSFDDPQCYFREEQVLNNVYDHTKKILRVGSGGKQSPNIKRIEITNQNTEESFVLPKSTTAFSIKDRGNSRMRYSFISGEVTNPVGEFIEFGPYAPYKEKNLSLTDDLTLYFASSKNGRVIEIVFWT